MALGLRPDLNQNCTPEVYTQKYTPGSAAQKKNNEVFRTRTAQVITRSFSHWPHTKSVYYLKDEEEVKNMGVRISVKLNYCDRVMNRFFKWAIPGLFFVFSIQLITNK